MGLKFVSIQCKGQIIVKVLSGRRTPAAVLLWVTHALVPLCMHPIPALSHDVLDEDLPALSPL